MAAVLYTYPNNFRAQKILIAAQYSKKDIKLADYVAGVTNQSECFLKKFPLGKVPAFEEGDILLSETNAISYFVGDDITRGGNNETDVLEWIGIADNDILPSACTWVYPTLGIMQYNKQATEKAKVTTKSVLNVLNNHLLSKTFLVGERVSQADISVACTLLMLYTNVLEPSFRSAYGNVNRWFVTLVNQPEFKAVLGDVKLCENMAQFDAKKFNEISGKAASKKKEPAKKEVNKVKTSANAAGDSIKVQPEAPVKKVDPWGTASKCSYDMDEWKRTYSNLSADEYMTYFFEKFPEEYSIWHCSYKYNDELAMGFMAGNMVSGMLQRIEKLRKFGFGNMIVLSGAEGSKNKFEIEGMWFWFGQELAFERSPDWQTDYCYYDWKKLDIKNQEVKEAVKCFWNVEGDFGQGRTVVEYEVFK